MIAVLERRLVEAPIRGLTDKPLSSASFARMSDVAAFLTGDFDDARCSALLAGMVWVLPSLAPEQGDRTCTNDSHPTFRVLRGQADLLAQCHPRPRGCDSRRGDDTHSAGFWLGSCAGVVPTPMAGQPTPLSLPRSPEHALPASRHPTIPFGPEAGTRVCTADESA